MKGWTLVVVNHLGNSCGVLNKRNGQLEKNEKREKYMVMPFEVMLRMSFKNNLRKMLK